MRIVASHGTKGLTGRQPHASKGEIHSARRRPRPAMIDNFALALSHGLLFIAFWRLAQAIDLDGTERPSAKQARSQGDPPGA